MTEFDAVEHPRHYNSHPSGVEVITITEEMNFCLGNAVKYILRADLKGKPIEDLRKAVWYVQREIDRREREAERLGQSVLDFQTELVEQGVIDPADVHRYTYPSHSKDRR